MESTSVLLLAGSETQLQEYDGLFALYGQIESHVLIIGGGRVGRATARGLQSQGIDYRLIDRNPDRIRDPEKYVLGDAAELAILQHAGIQNCSSVVITTHDDDMNVYLTIYCRRLRPEVQILARANQDRNVSTLHRAGADFVMSYASTGAGSIFNFLRRGKLLLLAEGLDMFRVPIPPALVGRSLAESRIRQETGCNVVAIIQEEHYDTNPAPKAPLPAGVDLIVVGDTEAEARFFERWNPH